MIDLFVDHLDSMGPVPKISLVLYTSGGDTAAAWNLVNLIRMFAEEFEVITPSKCRSAGTLVCLGADRIVMTKQATLGPIDPAIRHPLGPSIPGASSDARAEVSVEAVNGYLDAVRHYGGEQREQAEALLSLAQQIHPLVLGQIFRSRQQIRSLAERLLNQRMPDKTAVGKIVDFLCSESGSHDYTINRREADALGLSVEKCSGELYEVVRAIGDSYSTQMEFRNPHSLSATLLPHAQKVRELAKERSIHYEHTRAVIESVEHPPHHFVSRGTIEVLVNEDQTTLRERGNFDGWIEMK
ncbi:SDH family Clp fold serine proteinase [Candidatus Foliamicus sp.]